MEDGSAIMLHAERIPLVCDHSRGGGLRSSYVIGSLNVGQLGET